MIKLNPYSQDHKDKIIAQIADFFGFHASLILGEKPLSDEDYENAEASLTNWTSEDHETYVIDDNGQNVGFIHIWYRGPSVAWIEDVYVDSAQRGKGIASAAIALAEQKIGENPAYKAVCFDVVPRNENALKLYYKLGYTNLSLITVRKELGENKRDIPAKFLGFDFKI